jgi:ankyrin repeat protein
MPRPHRLRRDALLTTAVATAQGHTDVIELLLEHKADVNRAKSDGATPLFAAAQQ